MGNDDQMLGLPGMPGYHAPRQVAVVPGVPRVGYVFNGLVRKRREFGNKVMISGISSFKCHQISDIFAWRLYIKMQLPTCVMRLRAVNADLPILQTQSQQTLLSRPSRRRTCYG